MKKISDLVLRRGQLLELRCLHLYGSLEDQELRDSLVLHFGPETFDVLDSINPKKSKLGVFLKIQYLLRGWDSRGENIVQSPSCSMAVKILNNASARKTIILSSVGLGDQSVRLLSEVVRFMENSELQFVLMNYGNERRFENLSEFSPVSTHLVLVSKQIGNRFEFEIRELKHG